MKFRFTPAFLSALLLSLAAAVPAGAATLIWEQDFNSLEPSTAFTTANTNFGGANASNGALNVVSSTTGTGSALRISSATTAGNAAGAWVGAGGLGALTSMTVAFTLQLTNLQSGALGIYMGNGNTVAGNFSNTNLNDSHFLWDLSVLSTTGSLRYRDASGNYQDTGIVLTQGTTYQFLVQVNATTSAIDGVAANSMSIYVNGGLQASGLGLRAGTANANGFRIGGRSSTTAGGITGEIDDIRIWNGIEAIPEPSTTAVFASGAVLLAARRRRA